MRTRTHKRKKSSFLILPIIILAIALSFGAVYLGLDTVSSNVTGSSTTEDAGEKLSVRKIKENDIYSRYTSLIDVSTGKVLFEKNGDEKCYPASLTKIMTAIIAIENNDNINSRTSIDSKTLSALIAENASMAGYNSGENTTVEDLLYGCILASGADACSGLAKVTSGSETGFVEKMNQKAAELGMDDTHFTNTTGLHDDDHYTTANDLGKLLNYALKNKTFREVFTSQSRNIKTDKREFTVRSTFFSEYNGGVKGVEIKGAKTGTTYAAGNCLASYVKANGKKYILITANAPIGGSRQPFSFDDLDYVFASGTK